MKARIIREPRCALLWRIDESYPNYAAIARAAVADDVIGVILLSVMCTLVNTGSVDVAGQIGRAHV